MLPNSACSTSEAASLERELLEEYRFGRQQLVELCGHASAMAVTKVPAPITRVQKLEYKRAHRQTRPENSDSGYQTRQKWGPQRLRLGGGTFRVGPKLSRCRPGSLRGVTYLTAIVAICTSQNAQ